jgi:uncharacterized repeat protein (TIGR03803 family)
MRRAVVFGALCLTLGAACSQQSMSPLPLHASSASIASGAATSVTARWRQPRGASGYALLYSFKGGRTDGELPQGGLTALNGALYGMTTTGGACNFVCGTVYEMSLSGPYHVVFTFGNAHGTDPIGSLIVMKGLLYGTTQEGGIGAACTRLQREQPGPGCGTVFALKPSGAQTVLYQFKGLRNGALDAAVPGGLLAVNGNLYGIAASGGAYNHGAVFGLSGTNSERILFSFSGGVGAADSNPNPYYPYNIPPATTLVAVGGALYGTTVYGGGPGGYGQGCGTVFKVSLSGEHRILHHFGCGADGAFPLGGLVAMNGMLYGTTSAGGAVGRGTVFKIAPSSAGYAVIHSFNKSSVDGAAPQANLIAVNGVLYGTTSGGGTGRYYGTVFKITPTGDERVLYSFMGGSDGANPSAPLVDVNGTLYGTTLSGGAAGNGTIFKVTP